ncbi:hypothetical protein [Rothia nasimurium]|nr:hypothetical protein [Rothia nasimurium]
MWGWGDLVLVVLVSVLVPVGWCGGVVGVWAGRGGGWSADGGWLPA